MRQFSRMKMYTGWLADIYHPIFSETPICHWGYVYYDLNGCYLQIISDHSLLDTFLNEELYIEQILGDLDILDHGSYSSIVIEDNSLDDRLKRVIVNQGYTYFFDCIIRNNVSNSNFSTEKVTIASFIDPNKANNFVLGNISILNRICEDIAMRCRKLVNKENTLILPKDLIIDVNEIFENKKKQPMSNLQDKIIDLVHEEQTLSNFLDKSFNFNELPFSFIACKELTRKEKEIIYLYYYGFSLGRIACILEVSKRTVEKNFENIRKKLKCETSSQIIPTLIRFDNLITLSLRNHAA